MPENKKCEFINDHGQHCRRWAIRGSHFCYNHHPDVCSDDIGEQLHPLARLATPEDLFDVIRETLYAARQGRIAPGQAYSVCQLALLWLQLYKTLRTEHGHQTAVAELFGEPSRHHELPVRPMPLPVKIDEEASTEAPPPPRSAEEAHQRMQEAMAKLPPLHTPEQRAELHRQVAEIKARSEVRLAADRTAVNENSAVGEPLAAPSSSESSPVKSPSRSEILAAVKKLVRDSGGIFPKPAPKPAVRANGAAKSARAGSP